MMQERIVELQHSLTPITGEYIVYRMQASPRTQYNLTLLEAVKCANKYRLPLKILYILDDSFPDANYRHFYFLCAGIKEVAKECARLGIQFILCFHTELAEISALVGGAAVVFLDKGYLRLQRERDLEIQKMATGPVIRIEDNLVVPVEAASTHGEWAARTLRPKIVRRYAEFVADAAYIGSALPPLCRKGGTDLNSLSQKIDQFLERIRSQKPLDPVSLPGGAESGMSQFGRFLKMRFLKYAEERNDPSLQATSRISAYLHFGQISPLWILDEIEKLRQDIDPFFMGHYQDARDVWIEQMVVRRELAHNYIYYTPEYDTYRTLPEWARLTLQKHSADLRPQLYRLEELESAMTHDSSWNAAMREMITTGYMENTMRMYWGKKIMEWSPSMEEAYDRILFLNNKYFLDGRDANSYVGVRWCFGLHDRPWGERPIFGTIRYMNEAGLLRKYAMKHYIERFS